MFHRYAREDTHYLLYIYDVLRQKLLMSAAESENSDPPLTEASTLNSLCIGFKYFIRIVTLTLKY